MPVSASGADLGGSIIAGVGSIFDFAGSLIGRKTQREAIEGQLATIREQRLMQNEYFDEEQERLILEAEYALQYSAAGTKKIISIMVALAVVGLASAIIWRVVKAKTK